MTDLDQKPPIAVEVERIIEQYACEDNRKPSFKWTQISTPGSTSIRFVVENATNCNRKYFVKQFVEDEHYHVIRARQVEREYSALRYLKEINNEIFRTPAPVGILMEPPCVVMEYAPGVSAGSIIWSHLRYYAVSKKGMDDLNMIVDAAARILSYMQSNVTGDIPNVPRLDLAWYQRLLQEQCDSIIKTGHSAKEVERWYSICEKTLLKSWDCDDIVFQHTDFYQENIITNEKEFYLIDFANSSFGSRYFDLSLLFISLENYKLYRNVDWKVIDNLKSALVKYFDASRDLFFVMNICQYLFAYKIFLLNKSLRTNIRHKVFMRDLKSFYTHRINNLVSFLT